MTDKYPFYKKKEKCQIDINQDEICHATSKSFHGSSVQTKDVMSEKKWWMIPQTFFSAMPQRFRSKKCPNITKDKIAKYYIILTVSSTQGPEALEYIWFSTLSFPQ